MVADLFNDPVLDRLIAEADANNSTQKIAVRAHIYAQLPPSGAVPQVTGASAERLYLDRNQSGGRNPQHSSSGQYSAGFDVGWELDPGVASAAPSNRPTPLFAARQLRRPAGACALVVAETYFACAPPKRVCALPARTPSGRSAVSRLPNGSSPGGNSDELDLQQAKTQYLAPSAAFGSRRRCARRAMPCLY